MTKAKLAFALDYPDLESARRGAEVVAPEVDVLKVGLELFVDAGRAAVDMARGFGAEVFLDLKLHDIEKTVERAVGTASSLGVKYLTIHASGGPGMIEAASRRAEKEGSGLVILAVTVLTSLGAEDLAALGLGETPADHAARLALLAKKSGAHGLVCSSEEVGRLRALVGPEMVLVTPGIRPAGAALGDQKRVGTPADAVRSGSSVLVVGRPIRDAEDPAAAARAIVSAMREAEG